MDTIIPTGVLSKLNRLQKLSIDVNLDDEWWDADVKVILNKLSRLKSLDSLELYLPSVELLQQLFQQLRRDNREFTYPYLYNFKFTIGRHRQRLISRLPYEVEEIFKKQKKRKKYLEYINNEGMSTEITEVLNHATVFFLDRHWTVKMLSEFGNENMGFVVRIATALLQFCLVYSAAICFSSAGLVLGCEGVCCMLLFCCSAVGCEGVVLPSAVLLQLCCCW
ncbi:hypothetical protein LOK49_LG02G02693 [Camellia lanceoleosa]|uniref:Uncharacterized protein n=1 Tax=Camellia lanceoleosa TaxID=1840588 RepID=A0ACC0IJB5_9ERIC|nr:hypothetical protein LOK49_LG02G02693 [Camellia lanceoleosa]